MLFRSKVNFDKAQFVGLLKKYKINIRKIVESVEKTNVGSNITNTKHGGYVAGQMKDFSDKNGGGKATKLWNGFKATAIAAVQPVLIPGSSAGIEAAVSVIEVGRNFFDLARNEGLHCLKEIREQMAKAIHHERKIEENNKRMGDAPSKAHPILSLKKAWHIAWKSVHNCILQAEKIIRFVMVKKIKVDKVNYVKTKKKYQNGQMSKMNYDDKKYGTDRKSVGRERVC